MNKKITIPLFITGLLVLFSSKLFAKSSNKYSMLKDKTKNYFETKYGLNRSMFMMLGIDSLIDAGLTGQTLKFAIAQMMQETGVFSSTSKVALDNNNLSGIMWINKSYQKNAVKGSPFPPSEGHYFYAKFASLKDWAADYIRVLNLPPNYPIKATTLQDFNKRLKGNKYYTANEANYFFGLNFFYNMLDKLGY